MPQRRRRMTAVSLLALLVAGSLYTYDVRSQPPPPVINGAPLAAGTQEVGQQLSATPDSRLAGNVLETLPVKGRAPKNGYKRSQFGDGWAQTGSCDMRNIILARDMTDVVYRSPIDCTVMSGTLNDPYTGKIIRFTRGGTSSAAVQIDHAVALSNAWQTGAQQLTSARRAELANDPLELLATDGPANQQKSDADAATWLPANKAYRCLYVARQVAVKTKYSLWVTTPERDAIRRVLATCPSQELPRDAVPR